MFTLASVRMILPNMLCDLAAGKCSCCTTCSDCSMTCSEQCENTLCSQCECVTATDTNRYSYSASVEQSSGLSFWQSAGFIHLFWSYVFFESEPFWEYNSKLICESVTIFNGQTIWKLRYSMSQISCTFPILLGSPVWLNFTLVHVLLTSSWSAAMAYVCKSFTNTHRLLPTLFSRTVFDVTYAADHIETNH